MGVRDMAMAHHILTAFGLGDLHVISAQINIKAGQLTTADLEIELSDADGRPIFEDNDRGGEIVRELRHYELVERVDERRRA